MHFTHEPFSIAPAFKKVRSRPVIGYIGIFKKFVKILVTKILKFL